jgi:NADPH-dependent F420 reductase
VTEPIALLGGTGRSGPGLALRFALAGIPVVIGSRERAKGAAAAAEIGARVAAAGGGASVIGMDNAGAAGAAGTVLITVPYEGQAALLEDLAATLDGRLVVSTVVPMRVDRTLGPSHIDVPEGSAAEQAAALLPGARVVAAFHSLSSSILSEPSRPVDSDVLVTGDDAEAKARVIELAETLPGVRGIDAGPLRYARYSEQLTVLLLSVNRIHKVHSGVRITDLPAR